MDNRVFFEKLLELSTPNLGRQNSHDFVE